MFWTYYKKGQIKMMAVFVSTAIAMFSVALLPQASVNPPNIVDHENGFKCHAQPQTGAYSCYR